jgi:amino acid adenylation domain-containing protein
VATQEVEKALRSHEAIADVVVWNRDNDLGENHLVAYFTCLSEAPTTSELRRFLSDTLPDYMIPAIFVQLQELPLTPNGKIDRNALLEPDYGRPDLAVSYREPRNEPERKLSRIWAHALLVEQLGIDDNFFDLGGNSLAGAAVIAQVKEVFGVDLPVGDLFRWPTVRELSREIGRRSTTAAMLPRAVHPDELEATRMRDTRTSKLFPREELEQSIPARFEKIVRRYPDHIAIKSGNRSPTYSQLNAMANRVARSLVARRGTEPEPLGVLIAKGIEQIAAMLGVFKAGKFVVLLDPSFPLERNLAIIKETSPALILTDAANTGYATKLADADATVFEIESIDPGSDADDLDIGIAPDAFAYVVYTSGTTGQPKGVIQNHHNMLHRVMVYTNSLGITSNDRCILLSSGTANTVGNSLYALLTGATLYPVDVHELGPAGLAGYLVEEKISVCAVSTLLFRTLCESLTGRETFPALRILRLTSEASYKSDFELYKRYFPHTCRLVNMLLPTEAGTLRCFLMDHETQITTDEIPLGYPVEDKEIFLLDDQGREVGFSEVGEIVVRSRYLSPGYWLRPDLNEAKFKLDPHDPNQRLYYTGDLGLMLPDGCLIHKGRKDFRVKIRGYGVDLAEVERVLRSHNAIESAVVVGRTNAARETSLVAYFTSAPEQIPTTSELRQFLSKTVPGYMLPAVFIRLEALPLTPNGKVNRKALPQADDQRPQLNKPYAPARNQVERMLTKTWEEVLGVRPIGINDNFFDLGGDSLKLASMLSRVKDELGMEIAVDELLVQPEISFIGGTIEKKARVTFEKEDRDSRYVLNLRVGIGEKRIFCFPYLGGFREEYFNFCRISRHFGDEYSFYGLRARGVNDGQAPRGTIQEIAQDFIEAIMTVQPYGPYILVGECGGGIPAFETARQLQSLGEKVELLVLFDTHAWSLRRSIWRRIKEPLTYRKRLGFVPPAWEYFDKRLQHHWRELRQKNGSHRVGYLLDKFIKAPTAMTHSIQRGKKEVVATAGPSVLQPSSPPTSRRRLNEKDYFIAAHRYRYRPYSGRIALLVNEEWHKSAPDLGWGRFAVGGLDVYQIPGDHDHCVPDNIPTVAEILKEIIGQGNASDDGERSG